MLPLASAPTTTGPAFAALALHWLLFDVALTVLFVGTVGAEYTARRIAHPTAGRTLGPGARHPAKTAIALALARSLHHKWTRLLHVGTIAFVYRFCVAPRMWISQALFRQFHACNFTYSYTSATGS